MVTSALAVAATLAFLLAYSLIANPRDPIAQNSWWGGAWALMISGAYVLLLLGYSALSDWVAAVAWPMGALIMGWRAWIVLRFWRQSRNDDGN